MEFPDVVSEQPAFSTLGGPRDEEQVSCVDVLRVDILERVHELLQIPVELVLLEEGELKITTTLLRVSLYI